MFSEETNQTEENYLGKLTAEKGEQWKDPEVIAKGYVNAQEYIKDLERQTEELREDLTKNEYSKTLLDELRSKATETSTSAPETKDGSANEIDTKSSSSDIDLESLINEALTKREAENSTAQNHRTVDTELVKLFGTDHEKVVLEKGSELGMSREELKSLAGRSPSAFLTLMGQPAQKETNQSTQSSVNTENFTKQGGIRNWDYYAEMRKADPKRYHSPKVQREMLEDRKALGDKF